MKRVLSPVPILLVDDRPENLLVLEAVLASPEYELTRATSGEEALAFLKQNDCALLLLDVQMPSMDGFETALRVRKNPRSKNVPIIFITASIEDKDRIYKGYEAGAIDYIFKPFDPDILRSKVSFFVQLYIAKLEIKHQAELLSAQDEKNVSIVLENALDAVVGMNAKGEVIYWNSQAEKIFGRIKKEALGLLISEIIIPPKFRNLHEKGLHHFLTTGEGPILNKRIEVQALRKSGIEFPVELTVTPVERSGTFTFTAFVRDISERKKIEEDKKIEAMRLQDALKSRDEFVSICSHELKTPVTAMKLHFEMAKRLIEKGDEKVFSEESATRRVEMAINQLDRMARLINDMLDVTNISLGKLEINFQLVDLRKIIEEVIESFKEQFDSAGIILTFDTSLLTAMVMGDQYRLEQVISNLITNAIKYGEGKPVTVSLEQDKNSYLISVQDQGMGIDKEFPDKVFSKYERAAVPGDIKGLGLGLYITKQIIVNHKGYIEVKSVKGHGSTFIVSLPSFENKSRQHS